LVWREPKTEKSCAHTVEDGALAGRWHEESKRRYEDEAISPLLESPRSV
jgi:hypothetical protein